MFFDDIIAKFFYVLTTAVTIFLTWGMIEGFGDGTPKWLETPTHKEKKTGIKKYIGELHEELDLYAEATELQKMVREFKSKQ